MSRTAHPPDDRQINMMGLKSRRENLNVSGNICISATLSTTNPTYGLGSNPGLHPTQPALMPAWVRHKRDMLQAQVS